MKHIKKEWKILGILLFFFLILYGSIFFKTDLLKDKQEQSNSPSEEKKDILQENGIHPVNKETFLSEVNVLLEKGYRSQEINAIYESFEDDIINQILHHDYVDLSSFFGIPNFDFRKIDRYQAYQTLENIPMNQAVTRVNLKLDMPFYSEVEEIKDADNILVLVNKVYALPSNYEPQDLVAIPSFPSLKIRDDAVNDLEALLAAAKLDQIYLIPYSTYRSYSYQDELYQYYLKSDSREIVDTYSARPGHSEHQTGLALDVRSSSHWNNLTDVDYEWMKKNSYKYGFIIRYPKGNSEITGYKEEPWHIRYIGVEHATKVHELNITYDEYYDLYLQT